MLPRLPRFKAVLLRGCRSGIKSAFRHEGLATGVGALYGVLFLAQILLLLMIAMHAQLTLLRQQTDVRLVVRAEASDQQISMLIAALSNEPYVEDVVYITPEQALERVKTRDPDLVAFLTQYDFANPFPATIGVRLNDLSMFTSLVTFLQTPSLAVIVDPDFLKATEQDSQIRSIERATRAAQSALVAVIILLFTALLAVLIELLRRRVVLRREEILIQQLVGATHGAILMPFSVEILMLLFLAFLLSTFSVGLLLFALPAFVPSLSQGGLFRPWALEVGSLLTRFGPLMIFIEILLLPTLAAAGAALGLLPRLKKPTLSMS